MSVRHFAVIECRDCSFIDKVIAIEFKTETEAAKFINWIEIHTDDGLQGTVTHEVPEGLEEV